MRLLVTGSSGQIGSYVVDAARAAGHDVVGIDLRPSDRTAIIGDLRDPATCARAVRDADAVVHTAAQVSVQASIDDPWDDASHNILGTVRLLDASRRADASRFVHVSSAAVYGEPTRVPVDEDHPLCPSSFYGAGKLASEHYVRLFGELHGLRPVIVRPFNVYSIRQDPTSPYSGVLSHFARRVREGKPPIIFGDGKQTRDFVHAQDVAALLVRLAEGTAGGVLNAGTGTEWSILSIARLALDAAALDAAPVHEPERPGEIRRSVADVSRAHAVGWEPRVPLEEGIRSLVAGQPVGTAASEP